MKMDQRSNEQELLDLGPSHYTEEEYEDCLYQLSRVGLFLGGNRATLKTLDPLPKPNSILDMGCGGGQFAMELAKAYPEAQILGVDPSKKAIDFAKKKLKDSSLKNLNFEVSSIAELSSQINNIDVILCTLVCHHLTDKEIIDFFKIAYKTAKKSIVINDLHRHRLAYLSFGLIAGIFFRNRLITHDGLLSIKRSFKRKDWIRYLQEAEIPLQKCSIRWHWAFRWVLHIDTSSRKDEETL